MSDLRVNTISNLAGTGPVTLTKQIAAKHALRYDMVSNVIDNSMNCSSVTDNGTSNYDVAFTNNMANANFFMTCGAGAAAAGVGARYATFFAWATTGYSYGGISGTGTTDQPESAVIVAGDLA